MSTEIRCDGCGAPLDTPRTFHVSMMPQEDYYKRNHQAKDANAFHLGLKKIDLCTTCEARLFEGLRKLVK